MGEEAGGRNYALSYYANAESRQHWTGGSAILFGGEINAILEDAAAQPRAKLVHVAHSEGHSTED